MPTYKNVLININRTGSPSIASIMFNRTIKIITCTSTGGPPANVIWRKNDMPLNDSLYQQSQRLVDAETATYNNVLFNNDAASFVGNFTCQVTNVRGTAIKIVHLNGKFISLTKIIVTYKTWHRCVHYSRFIHCWSAGYC